MLSVVCPLETERVQIAQLTKAQDIIEADVGSLVLSFSGGLGSPSIACGGSLCFLFAVSCEAVVREVCKRAPEEWAAGACQQHQAALSKSGLNILCGQPTREFVYCYQAYFILPLGSPQFSSC